MRDIFKLVIKGDSKYSLEREKVKNYLKAERIL